MRTQQVTQPNAQHEVLIEAVENHMPEVIVVDEIGTRLEAEAARTIAQRGVQLVATAHGHTLENVIKNPSLVELVVRAAPRRLFYPFRRNLTSRVSPAKNANHDTPDPHAGRHRGGDARGRRGEAPRGAEDCAGAAGPADVQRCCGDARHRAVEGAPGCCCGGGRDARRAHARDAAAHGGGGRGGADAAELRRGDAGRGGGVGGVCGVRGAAGDPQGRRRRSVVVLVLHGCASPRSHTHTTPPEGKNAPAEGDNGSIHLSPPAFRLLHASCPPPRADGASPSRADKRTGGQDVVRLFAYGLDVEALKRVVVSLGLTARLELTQSLEEADAVLALKQRVKARCSPIV